MANSRRFRIPALSAVVLSASVVVASGTEDTTEITYSEASSIYARTLQRISKSQALDDRQSMKVEHLVLTWVDVGPCQQPWTRNKNFAIASGNISAARADTPFGIAVLASVGVFMRGNDGREVEKFACRYAAERLKELPAL